MKKAINISRMDAMTIAELKKDQVLISIRDRNWNYKPAIQDSDERMFCSTFGDCSEDAVEWRGTMFYGITDEQAREMYLFCEKHKDKDFIVHCTAGVSRSAAVCLFLNLCYDHVLKDKFFLTSSPNSRVVYKLLKAYYKNKNIQ